MASSKEKQLTQAIIDKNENEVDRLLKDGNVNKWISNHVQTSALRNHCLSDSFEWTTAMCRSCGLFDVATVKKLVGAGASLYDINSYGHTALIMACCSESDRMEKVKYLLKEDVKLLHATDGMGLSALHTASHEGHADVCEYLLNAGARVNAENEEGVTSLHLAAMNNRVAVIEILHRHGANLRQRAKNNFEPLHSAALQGANDAFVTLIELGADAHALGWRKRSALHSAAESGSVPCIKALVDRGVPVDIRDKDNVTPLHLAAYCDHAQCIHVLVDEQGADVNAQTKYGSTPLHFACQEGKLSAVEALVAHPNCDINIKNKEGKTARELAAANNHQHIALFFVQTQATKPLQRELSAMKREVKALKEHNAAGQSIGAMSISDDSKISAIELKKSIRRNMHWLVENIPAMPHVDFLYSHEALNEEDYQAIRAERTEAAKVRLMIMTLMEKPNVSWAPVFLDSLREKSDFAAEKILAK